MTIHSSVRKWPGVLAVAFIAAAGPLYGTARAEQAVAPEHNPPGDIPDSQVFIPYSSPDGYELQVPEGWGRTITGHATRFADKYDLISVEEDVAPEAPTVASVKAAQVPRLQQDGRAVEIKSVTAVSLKGGKAVRIAYNSNSEPNAVTGRKLRQEHERFIYFHDGKTALLDLAAPLGADNVDQWQLISNSFRWK